MFYRSAFRDSIKVLAFGTRSRPPRRCRLAFVPVSAAVPVAFQPFSVPASVVDSVPASVPVSVLASTHASVPASAPVSAPTSVPASVSTSVPTSAPTSSTSLKGYHMDSAMGVHCQQVLLDLSSLRGVAHAYARSLSFGCMACGLNGVHYYYPY